MQSGRLIFFELARAMRVHQWPKNLLVFLPALTSQEFDEPRLFLAALKAFLAFCAIASAVYLINDLADLEHDRQHKAKRHRPFAAGTLSTRWCYVLVPILIGVTILIGLDLGLLHLALNDAVVSHAAGYDVSTKAVGAAQTLPWDAERLHVVHRTPGEGVPDISGADYVTLCDVLHHVPPEAKAPFLKDIAEKMRPGAVLILVDIDASRRGGYWMNQLHDLIISQEGSSQ